MWSPNELLKIEKQRDILSYITLQFFHFKKVPLEHCPLLGGYFFKSSLHAKLSRIDRLYILAAVLLYAFRSVSTA